MWNVIHVCGGVVGYLFRVHKADLDTYSIDRVLDGADHLGHLSPNDADKGTLLCLGGCRVGLRLGRVGVEEVMVLVCARRESN